MECNIKNIHTFLRECPKREQSVIEGIRGSQQTEVDVIKSTPLVKAEKRPYSPSVCPLAYFRLGSLLEHTQVTSEPLSS